MLLRQSKRTSWGDQIILMCLVELCRRQDCIKMSPLQILHLCPIVDVTKVTGIDCQEHAPNHYNSNGLWIEALSGDELDYTDFF